MDAVLAISIVILFAILSFAAVGTFSISMPVDSMNVLSLMGSDYIIDNAQYYCPYC
jgi:hypothetical protein